MSKKTLSATAESGNHYLVKVKINQPKLYQQSETESNQSRAKQKVEHQEKTRDRNSYRKVEVFELPKNLEHRFSNQEKSLIEREREVWEVWVDYIPP